MPASLPSRAPGDLGAVLSNIRTPVTNELSAVNVEKIKDWIIALATELGLTDGSTSGSVWEALASAGGGISELTGDASAGPGTGSQAITVTQARGLRETGGPTTLAMGAVADGESLVRSGSSVVGATPPGFSHVAVTGNTTLPARNAIVSVDTSAVSAPGTLSLTLPAPVAGRCYFVSKTAGAYNETITLVRAASENIDGAAASRLLIDSDLEGSVMPTIAAWLVTSDGIDWFTLPIGRLVRHQLQAGPPVDTTHTTSAGFYIPGSTWNDTSSKRLYMAMAAASLSNTVWDRVDAVDVLTITGDTTLPSKDRQCFVSTTSGVVNLTLPDPTGRNEGRQYAITRTNASGTNKITLVRNGSESINGVAASFDLPGSATAAYGRWHVVSDGTNWWITGGTGLV